MGAQCGQCGTEWGIASTCLARAALRATAGPSRPASSTSARALALGARVSEVASAASRARAAAAPVFQAILEYRYYHPGRIARQQSALIYSMDRSTGNLLT